MSSAFTYHLLMTLQMSPVINNYLNNLTLPHPVMLHQILSATIIVCCVSSPSSHCTSRSNHRKVSSPHTYKAQYRSSVRSVESQSCNMSTPTHRIQQSHMRRNDLIGTRHAQIVTVEPDMHKRRSRHGQRLPRMRMGHCKKYICGCRG